MINLYKYNKLKSTKTPIKKSTKTPIKKSTKTPIEKSTKTPIEKSTKTPIEKSIIRSQSYTFLAYLNDSHSGFFYNKDNPINDYFYTVLNQQKKQQIKLLENDLSNIKYITPFNSQGFKFKSTKNFLLCYRKSKIIDYSKCINKLGEFTLIIRPYDFINNGKRIAGLSIKVIYINFKD